MSRDTFPFAAAFVAVATVLFALLAGGVWWWLQSMNAEQAPQAEPSEAVKQCTEKVARRDPVAEARRDLEKGEESPLFVKHHGMVLTISADGIPGCELNFDGPDWRFPDFDYGPRTDEQEPVCCDRDPVPNACGQAQDDWIRAYNRELARLKPELVEKYCAARGEGH